MLSRRQLLQPRKGLHRTHEILPRPLARRRAAKIHYSGFLYKMKALLQVAFRLGCIFFTRHDAHRHGSSQRFRKMRKEVSRDTRVRSSIGRDRRMLDWLRCGRSISENQGSSPSSALAFDTDFLGQLLCFCNGDACACALREC